VIAAAEEDLLAVELEAGAFHSLRQNPEHDICPRSSQAPQHGEHQLAATPMEEIMRRRAAALAATAAFLTGAALAGCGGTSTMHTANATQTANATPSGAVSCAQAKPLIQLLVKAQGKLDASQQTINDDLLYNIALAEGIAVVKVRWPVAGTQLGRDLHQFQSDASQYTSGGLASQQAAATDISTLATDCGVA
jgi:hypothetical protein